jgi:hypothetical protein
MINLAAASKMLLLNTCFAGGLVNQEISKIVGYTSIGRISVILIHQLFFS